MREIQKSVARESELQEEINRLQDKVVNGSKNELAILNRRFVEETAATKARHEAEVAELQVRLCVCACVCVCVHTCKATFVLLGRAPT